VRDKQQSLPIPIPTIVEQFSKHDDDDDDDDAEKQETRDGAKASSSVNICGSVNGSHFDVSQVAGTRNNGIVYFIVYTLTLLKAMLEIQQTSGFSSHR